MSEENQLNKLFENLMSYEPPKVVKEYNDMRTCLTHNQYKVHVVEYDNGDVMVTPCCCPECERERKEEIARRNAERFKQEKLAQYEKSNISKEYLEKDFSDFIASTKAQKAALSAVQEMVETKKGKIIIIGSNGVGKTLLGSLAVMAMGGYIYTMFEISTRIRQSYASGAKETELEILEELVNAPLLVIDEIGRVKITEAVLDWFSYIIDKRHTYGKPIILLGNLHFGKDCDNKDKGGCSRCFENCFDNDCISRLRQDSKIIEIISSDKRCETKSGMFITDRG